MSLTINHHPRHRNLFVLDFPLISHRLTSLRDVESKSSVDYRRKLGEIAELMVTPSTIDLRMTTKRIKTPLEEFDAPVLADQRPIVVPILRAALAMHEPFARLLEADIGMIGVYRDHKTCEPHEYMAKLPPLEGRPIFLVDPMLATGGSAIYAIEYMLNHGADINDIRFISLVSVPEGVKAVHSAFPELRIYTAALDSHLNAVKYIVPGLGDAGDRAFGTEKLAARISSPRPTR